MFVFEDICYKLNQLEDIIEIFRQKLHLTVEKNNGDLLTPEVIKVSTKLDSYLSKYMYLSIKVQNTNYRRKSA